MGKTALIFGATGATGKELLSTLNNDLEYSKIYVFHYRPTGLNGEKVIEVVEDFANIEHVTFPFETIDEVYSCIGTTIKRAGSLEMYKKIDCDYVISLAKRMKAFNMQSFTLISSAGANAQSSNYYLKIKGEVEEQLQLLSIPSLHIFRPGALFGVKRSEFRWKEFLSLPFLKLINPLLIGKLAQYKMTHIHTLAKALVKENKNLVKGTQLFLAHQIS